MSDAPRNDWTGRKPDERLAETERLRRERHGAALDAQMALVVRIIDIKTGQVLHESGDGSPRRGC